MVADILNTLAAGTATDLRPLQVKLTYVGPQTKSVPTVVFTTFYHIPVLNWFVGLRTPGLHYSNDDIALWSFTVTPEEMSQVVNAIAQPDIVPENRESGDPFLSFMMAAQGSRIGSIGFETVVNCDQFSVLSETIRNALDSTNQLARSVIDRQRQLILT
jgi:hypothetical protein